MSLLPPSASNASFARRVPPTNKPPRTQVTQRLAPQTRILLDGLLERSVAIEEQDEQAEDEQPTQETGRRETVTWQDLKTNPGAVGLESMLYEDRKLRVLSQLALPADLFGEASPHVITRYRQRAATETLHELRRHPDATRYALLAAFCCELGMNCLIP